MAITAFIFLVIFLSIYLEVLAGSMGIIVPATAIALFYLSIAYGWRCGLLVSLIAGTVIDMLYGRSMLITPYCMMLTVPVSLIWLHKGDPSSILPNLIPGSIAAFIVAFPPLLINAFFNGIYLHNFYLLVFSILCGAFMLPVVISLLDFVAERQRLPLYRKARALALERK